MWGWLWLEPPLLKLLEIITACSDILMMAKLNEVYVNYIGNFIRTCFGDIQEHVLQIRMAHTVTRPSEKKAGTLNNHS